MKLDRRSFLSFLLGGAAGTALSPLPWKLTDDISIWTQMWPWTPVPQKGEFSYINSVCTLCPGGCGITVTKVEDRVIKIEGLKGHPVNDGRLCLLGLAGAQLLYGPGRIKAPLKKVDGRFRKISWNEAITEVATQLGELRLKGEPHKVAFIYGSDRGTMPEFINRFLTVYGSPNFIRTQSMLDSYELVLHLMQGVRAVPGFDVENADFVLSFGSGILDGWGSPVHMFLAHSKWRQRGSKMVQIEPRLSNTAAKSDQWIPVKPGTEGALALGIAHVIIKDSLYSKEFVDNYSAGFNKWKRPVMDGFSPDIVTKITGVDKSTITTLARNFAKAANPLALCGRGRGATPGSIKEFMAVHALNALVGNINKQGGIWAIPELDYIKWPDLEMDGVASKGMQTERIDGAGGQNYPNARYLLNQLPERINSATSSPIQALFIAGSNPLYTLPDTATTKEAFAKIPFIVSFSSFMDETAEVADLILPNHIYLERYEDVPVTSGVQYPLLGLTKPVVDPLYNTKQTGDVIILLAKALGGFIENAFPWESYQSCLVQTLEDKWDALVKETYWTDGAFKVPPLAQTFETASRKFEFTNDDIDSLSRFSLVMPEGDEAIYPLVLIPYDSMRLASDFIGNPPFMIKTVEDTVLKNNDILVEVNPDTARALGISDGQTVTLTTPKGSARVKIHVFDGILPGVVAMPRGLGHTAYNKYLADKGVNVNLLIGSLVDSASGHNAAWGIRAKLSKA
jgi:anaerobic selenocysteine-containing dehydrogenase